MGKVLYSYDKNDIERIIRKVVNEVKKTSTISNEQGTLEEDRLSQKEAAAFLGVTVTSLIKWKKQKKVPFYQVGRSIFYSKKELLEVAKKNQDLIKVDRK